MLGKLIIASLLTGIISGFFITVYELLIELLTHIIFMGDPFKTIPTLPTWYLYLAPTVAIFIVNYFISKDKYIREYGVNEIAESISENRMILTIKTLFLKIITSALSISSGFAVGTEGPSAGIGAMIAYQIHKIFKLPTMLIKMMISVGASSGIAAIFVSPVTGMAFAIENIAYQFIKQYIGYVILGSVIAFSISAKFLDTISFNFHTYRNFIFSLIGGSAIGTILLIEPHAAFSGKEMVIHLINNKEHIPLLFIFIYANAVGGLFLPTMSIGALVGYGYGELITQIHHLPLEPFFFAAVGAAVFMGVIMKLPLTAVILALETTFDYNVMVATGVSVVLVSYLSNLHFDIRKKYVTKADKIVE